MKILTGVLTRTLQAVTVLGLSTSAQAYDYTLTLFGQSTSTLNAPQSLALGVTNSGFVVGTMAVPNPQFPTSLLAVPFTSVGGVTTVINNGISGSLRATNNSGISVGSYQGNAFFYDGETGRSASTLRGVSGSVASAVNDNGIAAGTLIASDGQRFAATWNSAQAAAMPTVLVGLDSDWPFGGQQSAGNGITFNGTVVGVSVNAAGVQQPVVWAPGSPVSRLPTGNFVGGGVWATTADGRYMSGYVTVNSGGLFTQAAMWNQAQLVVLPTVDGTFQSYAYGANASGVAVGSLGFGTAINGVVTDAIFRGAIWQGSSVVDLNTLINPAELPEGAYISSARGINDTGSIVGQITFANRGTQAFLMTPVTAVPEPAHALLLLSGLAVLSVEIRRRARRQHALTC